MSEPGHLCVSCSYCDGAFVMAVVGDDVQLDELLMTCQYCGHPVHPPKGTIAENKPNEPAERPPRDLKYHKSTAFEIRDRMAWAVTRTHGLYGPVWAFLGNISRLHSLHRLPVEMVFLARVTQQSLVQATHDITGGLEYDESKPEIGARANTIFREWQKRRVEEGRLSDAIRDIGEGGLDTIAGMKGVQSWLGLEASLTAQLTGAWTAFEVMAGDLWEAAINAHPLTLASLSGNGGQAKLKNNEKNELKSVSLDKLGKHHFDILKKMGSILREGRNFTTLEGIQKAYSLAFDDRDISSVLASEALTTLSLVRNVIVHRAGVVDEKFMREGSGLKILSILKEDCHIPIDGELVQQVAAPAIEKSLELIRLVDAWICNNPA